MEKLTIYQVSPIYLRIITAILLFMAFTMAMFPIFLFQEDNSSSLDVFFYYAAMMNLTILVLLNLALSKCFQFEPTSKVLKVSRSILGLSFTTYSRDFSNFEKIKVFRGGATFFIGNTIPSQMQGYCVSLVNPNEELKIKLNSNYAKIKNIAKDIESITSYKLIDEIQN